MNYARILTKSEEATALFGVLFAEALEAGDILSLDGDLGAGKTAFSKGLSKGLGIEDMISSPTFMLVMEHENPNGLMLFHFDVYRLSGSDDFFDAGLDEYFSRGGVCVIEWGDVISEVFSSYEENTVYMKIEVKSENAREFTIFYPSQKKTRVLSVLEKIKAGKSDQMEVLSC